ncbi:KilA-N domain-containing protein [Pontibacter korlensis]|uniref:KilA-N domain-containing protein n=1 Tax=Pontibacter korlensis TaxID=400092 RepID=A0A0E3ZDL8_9BACT|nr:KilA-N domain-containing protein [Pontibacter korlensis]AKD03293.1 hypothetical protein PKOR_09355 [Pontibacter korlensis]
MNELNVRQDDINDFKISVSNTYGEIPFCLVEEDMVEAGFMERRFKDKKIHDFIKKENVKDFMHELSSDIFGPALVKRNWGLGSETWMHKILALKYAAWLNPSFELWVYKQAEKILSDEHNLKWEDNLVLQTEE